MKFVGFKPVCVVLALFGLNVCDREPPAQPGGDFAVLARSVDGFSAAQPGHVMKFPRDHGPHPDFRIEWWYLTANLRDESGNPYGVHWTLFRLARQPQGAGPENNPWNSNQVYMAHMALTWPQGHVGFQRYARAGDHGGIAQSGAQAQPFRAWMDDWLLRSIGRRWLPMEVAARQGDFAFELILDSDQGPVLQGDKGFSRKHPDGSGSYYYSQPFLRASGRLTVGGKPITVWGEAWLDREWSSQFLQPDQAGWDWLALHLDSGEKLMLFRLRRLPDAVDTSDIQFGVLISPRGRKRTLDSEMIQFEPLSFERIAGRDLPLEWRIGLPEIKRELHVRALIPDQWMDVDFAYWEGVVVATGGDAGSRGRGYLELTGYPQN